jgi:hypothetical protein
MEEQILAEVSWEEVKPAATLAFAVWMGQPELVWAEKTWSALGDAKLTAYATEVERYQVLFRLLVLGGIYSDFCDAAWGEYSAPTYSDWASPLELDPFVVGQLYAQVPEWTPESDQNEALEILVENERTRVVAALMVAFGGASGLYAALWNSKNLDEEPESDEENDTYTPDADQSSGYAWVDQGCDRYR